MMMESQKSLLMLNSLGCKNTLFKYNYRLLWMLDKYRESAEGSGNPYLCLSLLATIISLRFLKRSFRTGMNIQHSDAFLQISRQKGQILNSLSPHILLKARQLCWNRLLDEHTTCADRVMYQNWVCFLWIGLVQ